MKSLIRSPKRVLRRGKAKEPSTPETVRTLQRETSGSDEVTSSGITDDEQLAYTNQINDLKSKLAESNGMLSLEQIQAGKTEEELKSTTKEHASKLQEMGKDMDANTAELNANFEKQSKALLADLAVKDSEIEQIQSDLDSAAAAGEKSRTKLEQEAQEYEAQLVRINEEKKAELARVNEIHQGKVSELQNLIQMHENESVEINAMFAKQGEGHIAKIAQKNKEIDELTQSLNTAKHALEAVTKEKEEIQKEAEETGEKLADKNKEVEELKQSLSATKQAFEEVMSEKTSLQKVAEAQSEKLAYNNTEIDELKQSLSTAEQAFEEVVTEKKELENKLANPLEEIKAIGVENDKLIEQISQVKQDNVKAARNAKNQRKALIQEHAEEMEKMKKDHDKLASELSDTHAVETEALVTEISTKSKQTKEVKAELHAKYIAFNASRAELEKKADMLREKMAKTTKEYEDRIVDLQNQTEKSENNVSDLELSMKEQRESFADSIAQKDVELDKLRSEVDTVISGKENALKEREVHINELQFRVKKADTKNSRNLLFQVVALCSLVWIGYQHVIANDTLQGDICDVGTIAAEEIKEKKSKLAEVLETFVKSNSE